MNSFGSATRRDPMSDQRSTRVILIVHSHWDREWYQPFEVFRQRLVRLVDRLMDILDADPDFKSFHLDGQTIPLLDYEQIAGRSDRLRRLVRAGPHQDRPLVRAARTSSWSAARP
ncbi:MAG: hypothetical protein MZU95_15890 [Desulfomicrobium escambiense]|nr:hypothetical protein [Desulfomicrobium escambiense]